VTKHLSFTKLLLLLCATVECNNDVDQANNIDRFRIISKPIVDRPLIIDCHIDVDTSNENVSKRRAAAVALLRAQLAELELQLEQQLALDAAASPLPSMITASSFIQSLVPFSLISLFHFK
jgi:hypothetical protein